MIEDPCFAALIGRRRIFWATQPDSCGTYTLCGFPCGIPGLEYTEPREVAYVIEAAHATDTVNAAAVIAVSLIEPAAAKDYQDKV